MPNYRLEAGTIQYGFYSTRSKVQIFGGGFANGKTTALVIKALKLAKNYPGSSGLLARETYPKLNDTLRKEFLRWCPRGWIKRKPTQEENSCYLKNGSVVHFRYVAQKGKSREDGTTTSNLLSATYDWIGVDQVEDPGITHKDFLDLLGRLRGDTPYRPDGEESDDTMPSNGPRWLMLTANPSYGWFYKELVHPFLLWRDKGIKSEKLIVDEDTGVPIISLYEGSTYTNKKNLPRDYIKGLEATYKGQQKKRYIEGEWAAFEGLVHPEFEEAIHTLTRGKMIEILEDLRKRDVKIQWLEGYDFGIASPSCYMLAFVDDYGRVFIIDGFYQPNFQYDEQPDVIRDIREKYDFKPSKMHQIRADPAIFRRQVVAKSRNTGDTVAKLLNSLGLNLKAATNDILPGVAKINAYLSGMRGIVHPTLGTDPSPLLYTCADLTWCLEEFASYYWKRNTLGIRIDEPIDGNDHAMNTLKYMLSHLPDPSQIVVPKKKLPPKWSFWNEMSTEDYRARQQAEAA